MKILITMPCVNNVDVTTECLRSIVDHPVDIILCQNGATAEIKELFASYGKEYSHKIKEVWDIPINNGLNPVLNMFMKYFLEHPEYTHLAMINSDIILHNDWLNVIKKGIEIFGDTCFLPTEVDKITIFKSLSEHVGVNIKATEIEGGANGMIMWMNRKHVEICYPMPEDIKIWFGDNWCLDFYRAVGFKTLQLDQFLCFHHGSATIKTLSTTSQWIEDDKIAWRDVVEPEMKRRIKYLKNKSI